MTDKLTYNDLDLQFYTNTRHAFAGLAVSDLVKAAVIAPLNILLVGDTGTGKTQLAKDIYNSYFCGNKNDGGQGIMMRAHPELDIYNDIFTELNISKAAKEPTKNIEALVYFVDELNRAPAVAQNQFFGLGDGMFDHKGNSIRLGKDGYMLLIATANIGNGEFQGTFETDKALYNRLHVAIDFDYEIFKPTKTDEMLIDKLKADPNVKEANAKDISAKIIEAGREISEITKNPGLEALAVVNYLRFGLDNCQKYGSKEKTWPLNCQDCGHNKGGDALCSLIRAPVRRTQNAMLKYAAALQYLAKLKDPDTKIDLADLMFKAFELTGAYQLLLNPHVLKQEHYDQNPKLMAQVVERLKEDFRKNEDFISASLEEAQKGRNLTAFFEQNGQIGDYQQLSESNRKKVEKIEPYVNKREIGMGWMKDLIDFQLKQRKE